MSNGEMHTGGQIHAGHRARLRARYACSGLDDFAPHEVLELLLTYCIQQKDVNGSAHALLNRFGSLSAVLDASPEELMEVSGIGLQTATFLTALPDVFRYYATDRVRTDEPMLTLSDIGSYLMAKYTGLAHERVYLLLFDNAMRLLDCCTVSDGAVNSVHITVRKMAELALRHHAACVVMAHNHPHGLAIPSGQDYDMTEMVCQALDIIGVPLIEHIIVTENNYAPILRRQKGTLRASPDGVVNEAFYRHFYGEAEM